MGYNRTAEQEVLNRVAAIRAAAEILHDNENMPCHERHVFLAAITDEAARLSRLIQGYPWRDQWPWNQCGPDCTSWPEKTMMGKASG